MDQQSSESLHARLAIWFRAHPWHGVDIGPDAPDIVTTYVEIVPTDTVKYELDKITGLLKIDRPQKYSNYCPTLYGLVPQTYCGERVGARCAEQSGRAGIQGDGDPLDICILTEKEIPRGDILVRARPIGGFRLIDGNEADDKIIAVMPGDAVYGDWLCLADCPVRLIERLEHYFLTYKDLPGAVTRRCEMAGTYNAEEARHVISLSREDYRAHFPECKNAPPIPPR